MPPMLCGKGWLAVVSMAPMADSPLLDSLPPEQRLALAYAPQASRALFLGVFALDAKLAGIVRAAREPMLAQLRLAWWRERLAPGGGATMPKGEPILAALAPLLGQQGGLGGLVDGWEAMLLADPLGAAEVNALAEGRAAAMAALASHLGGQPEAARRAGREWALADLASRIGSPQERAQVIEILSAEQWQRALLARNLRPLKVLHGLARRHRGAQPLIAGPGSLLAAIRLGLTGY